MTIKELKHNLALFPDSLEVKVECDGLERDVSAVTCFYPLHAKQYAIVCAEDWPDTNGNGHLYHTTGRCNDNPEPVVTPEMKQRAQETATKFSFDRR